MDDHELVLRATARMLSDFQTVVPLRSSKQALAMLRSGPEFDVVVSDVMMPEMNGPDLLAHCYVHSPDLARRFIFASGEPSAARDLLTNAITRVGSPHCPPLLEKPISRDALVAAVLTTGAYTERLSGTYSLRSENSVAQVRKYWG